MRNRLIANLVAEASQDDRLMFLTGDLGFNVVEPLAQALGRRFINAGVAEANMVTMAGALAGCGLHPWVYSIAPFATARCLEQIRNDVCYERRRVRIIGVGGGYSYGTLGPTHHALEDTALLACLPEIRIANPSTPGELDALFEKARAWDGPVYFRLDREDGPPTPPLSESANGEVWTYRTGSAGTVVTAGSILGNVLAAADQLASEGCALTVLTVPQLTPFPLDQVVCRLEGERVFAVYEGFSGNPLEVGVLRAALRAGLPIDSVDAGRAFASRVGGTGYLRACVGLDAAGIASAVRRGLDASSRHGLGRA